MILKIIKENYDRIEFLLEGEDHTFCNAFVQFIKKFNDIDIATYKIEHPLIIKPKIYIKLKLENIPIEKIVEDKDKIIKLKEIGIETMKDLVEANFEEVSKKTNIDTKELENYRSNCIRKILRNHLDSFIEYMENVVKMFKKAINNIT